MPRVILHQGWMDGFGVWRLPPLLSSPPATQPAERRRPPGNRAHRVADVVVAVLVEVERDQSAWGGLLDVLDVPLVLQGVGAGLVNVEDDCLRLWWCGQRCCGCNFVWVSGLRLEGPPGFVGALCCWCRCCKGTSKAHWKPTQDRCCCARRSRCCNRRRCVPHAPHPPEWSTPDSIGLHVSCSAPPQHITASGCCALVFHSSLVVLLDWISRGAPLRGSTA